MTTQPVPTGRPGAAPEVMAAVEVGQVLSGLDPVEREALWLIYWRGMTQDEAARALAVPASTVRTGVARGMRALAQRLTVQT